MSATIAERVAAGAAFLDTVEPDWFDRIDVESLDLGSCDSCLCGQIGGGWRQQVMRWWPDMDELDLWRWSDEHGFSSTSLEANRALAAGRDPYADLTGAWRELIAARRAEAGDF